MASTIQIRVDDDLKKKSDRLFKDLGTDTTSAIRIFLTQAVAANGFPFEIRRNPVDMNLYAAMSEEEMLERLSVAREHSAQGKQREAKLVISDIRTKL
ncbi:MAG: type II toxin-antitoxin system RelB/DinJ family antitoxin [Clostridiales bacterium]|nr:type II toxin-antitoxin system RelB/DinJ family antitoxin [Clostridiales bacterium]